MISELLRDRFIKDTGIPITLTEDPYFYSRIQLTNNLYGSKQLWDRFINTVMSFGSEEDYLDFYDSIKETLIYHISHTEGYQRFLMEDMNKFGVKNRGKSRSEIYKSENDGKILYSIDMQKANFSALRHYDPTIFDKVATYEKFISRFTDHSHIIESKRIRQIVFGLLASDRIVTYEKWLMGKVLDELISVVSLDKVISMTNDEIIIDISGCYMDQSIILGIGDVLFKGSMVGIPLHGEVFKLSKIKGTHAYIKRDMYSDKISIKCAKPEEMPFILRRLNGEDYDELDFVMKHGDMLVKMLKAPNIEI